LEVWRRSTDAAPLCGRFGACAPSDLPGAVGAPGKAGSLQLGLGGVSCCGVRLGMFGRAYPASPAARLRPWSERQGALVPASSDHLLPSAAAAPRRAGGPAARWKRYGPQARRGGASAWSGPRSLRGVGLPRRPRAGRAAARRWAAFAGGRLHLLGRVQAALGRRRGPVLLRGLRARCWRWPTSSSATS
jgi:hypothetical protein